MNELIVFHKGTALLDAETAVQIAEFERQVKTLKDKEDALKAAILAEMENKGIVKLETPELAISYIQPTERETFDTKAFKKDEPDLYDSYVKMSPVKSSIRIKLK